MKNNMENVLCFDFNFSKIVTRDIVTNEIYLQ